MDAKDIIDAIKTFTYKLNKVKEINANQYSTVYSELGINLSKLGCIMVGVDGAPIQNIISDSDLYFSQNPDRYWIKGFVAGSVPHVTLLYGLLKSGNTTYRKYVDEVLVGWSINSVQIDHIGFFDSPYPDDPYFCLVAHVAISPALKDANQRLQLLPHINTFPEYKAHITIGYIKQDVVLRDTLIAQYNLMLQGKTLNTKGLNYGK
jgi:hypothetical protein